MTDRPLAGGPSIRLGHHRTKTLSKYARRLDRFAIGVGLLALCWTVPPSADAATPPCGSNVTGNVTFTEDLADCPENGLNVAADNITIDLAGFVLQAVDNAIGSGIDIHDHSGITIKNGVIWGFLGGVNVDRAKKIKISGVTFLLNKSVGMAVYDADGVTIEKSTFRNAGNIGLALLLARSGKVKASAFVGNEGRGLWMAGSTGFVISDVIAAANGGSGAHLEGVRDVSIRSSVIGQNAEHGVKLERAARTSVSKSTIVGNILDGIHLDDARGEIDVAGGGSIVAPNTIGGNLIGGNLGYGINVGNGSHRNTITKNRVLGNTADGIAVDATSNNVTVNGNTAIGNREDGISIRNASATVGRNVADANRGAGIGVLGAVHDAGRNRARANGSLVQCSPAVVCPPAFVSKVGGIIPFCGMVVSTSTVLGADMPLCASGNGITVDADDVTIDLNSHSLQGFRVAGQIGIDAGQHANVTVKNGRVRGFGVGITMGEAAGQTLTNVEVRDNLNDGASIEGTPMAVTNSVFANNSGAGLTIGTFSAPKITGSSFVANSGHGLRSFALGGKLAKVTATANGLDGVALENFANATLSTVLAAGNLDSGVRVGDSASAAVAKSTAVGNGEAGFLFETVATTATIASSLAAGNGNYGIDAGPTLLAAVIKNKVIGNGNAGLNAFGQSASLVNGNTAIANRFNGLNLLAPSVVAKNVANGNGTYGIFLSPQGTDGGGNKARHNGHADCVDALVCKQ